MCVDLRVPFTQKVFGWDKGFTPLDWALFAGLRERELRKCRCGVDQDTAWNEEEASWLEVESQHCYACESLQRWQKQNDDEPARIPFFVQTSEDD